jgi:hypothetical protein
MAFFSRFDGIVSDMSHCQINTPPILLMTFFLWSLHLHHNNLLKQFRSCYKALKSSTLDSIVAGVRVGSDKMVPTGKSPCMTTALTNTDKQGKEWNNPFEWLAHLCINSLKLVGNSICPICNCDGKVHKHVPANCLLLKDLNLKLIQCPLKYATLPANAPSPGAPVAYPGGCLVMTDDASAVGSSGFDNVPSGLLVILAEEEFASDDEFCWDGDESSLNFQNVFVHKSNNDIALYPYCLHVSLERTQRDSDCIRFPKPLPADASSLHPSDLSSCCILLSRNLQKIIARMLATSILPGTSWCFTITDSGAFWSYWTYDPRQVRIYFVHACYWSSSPHG